MLPVGEAQVSERGTRIEIVEREGDRMSFERSYAPNTGKADPHLHQDFTQTWHCVSGSGGLEVEGGEREFTVGDRVEIAPNTPHRDPWNPGEGELIVRASFDPCNEFIEAYAEAWAHHLTKGTTNSQDEMPLLQIIQIANETDGRSYRAGVPVALQRATGPLVAWLARRRGYRARYDD